MWSRFITRGNKHTFVFLWLMFDKEPKKSEAIVIHRAMEEKFGKVDIILSNPLMTAFAVHKYISEFARYPVSLS